MARNNENMEYFFYCKCNHHFMLQIYNQKLKPLTPLPHFMYEKQTEVESDDKLRIKLCLRREKAGRCFLQCPDSKSTVRKTCSLTGAK